MADGYDEAAREALWLSADHPLVRELLELGLTDNEFAILMEILSDRDSISLSEAEAVLKVHGLPGKPRH